MAGRAVKMTESGGDMIEKSVEPFLKAEKSEGPEGLQKALSRGLPEKASERGPIKIPFCQSIIKGQKFVKLATGEFYIRIAEERTKIIERASEAHSLEVDEEGFSVANHHILGLEVTVNEGAPCSFKPVC
jgi:hypothetical protein